MGASTILVIEDNELNLKLVRTLLDLEGYRVLEAEDAESGIRLASLHLPDLILMDIQLPGMDGLAATRILKDQEKTRAIPIVALTGFAMASDELKAREAGCDGYITKPINTRNFRETIAMHMNQRPVSNAPAAFESHRHKNRILIVDDDPLNVKLLSAKLPADQYEALPAFSGEEALRRTKEDNPDLILLDVMMPEMDGYEVSQLLKSNPATEGIPIILVTALDGSENKIRGFEAGADEFLNKPVNDVELLMRINSLLRLKCCREQLLSRTQSEKGFSAHPASATPEEETIHPARILLVEDDDKDTRIIQAMLAGEPYDVEHVKAGEEALAKLQKEQFDLVLLDIILPGLDGFEVCRQLKGLHQSQDLQIILITCLSDLDNKVRGVELGADDYLIKPVNSRELKARMKVLIKKRRHMDQLRNNCESAINSAICDGLTGLHNQTYFKKFLDLEIKRAGRQKYPIGLVIIDVDDFKKINDDMGHLTGDLMLKELARLIKNSIREIDLSARYGGDEFVVVLPYSDHSEARQMVDRLQGILVQWGNSAEKPPNCKPITLSIGVAFYPDHGASVDELIRRADEALYQAKSDGKNRCCFMEKGVCQRP